MPYPTKEELESNDRDGYLSRCISFMENEKPHNSREQNVAICYSYWRQAKDREG